MTELQKLHLELEFLLAVLPGTTHFPSLSFHFLLIKKVKQWTA